MAGLSANSQSQRPFSNAFVSLSLSLSLSVLPLQGRPLDPINHSNLVLRFLALAFSFVSALSLAASSSNNNHTCVCDIAHRGIPISIVFSEYLSFILDQLVGYLLESSCSVSILASQHTSKTALL
ncbi:CASP-like protein 4A4 [Hevea brasiliensis]|uniref:CASP-like protein 4A4 n=1 Tax=Hevea brasiliensis TaxID=3981 RepID=UPI0025F95CC9|nr:CASP-like protein 4A4 [Hevea brasiliensis]